MTEQELSNRWMAAILEFDWSKKKEGQKENHNLENEENLA